MVGSAPCYPYGVADPIADLAVIALATLNTGRLSLPAMCVGGAKWCLNVARGWSSERVQWGRPIGDHEAIATKIAFIAGTTYAMESMLDLCCMLADDETNDIRIEAALVKLYTSEMAWKVADELVQLRGGRGYETADSLEARGERPAEVEQLLRDLRINRIFEGSTEIMHLLIAREAVDAHLDVAGDIIDPDASARAKADAVAKAAGFYAGWLPTLVVGAGFVPGAYRQFGPLAEHVRFVERSSRRLAAAIFAGMARWQGAMERRQAFLGRAVDIGAELFAMTASCVRAKAEASTDPTGVELADAFCEQARVRVEALFTALWHNSDASDRKLARKVLEGRYAKLEQGVRLVRRDLPWVAPWRVGPSTTADADTDADIASTPARPRRWSRRPFPEPWSMASSIASGWPRRSAVAAAVRQVIRSADSTPAATTMRVAAETSAGTSGR